MHQPTSRSTPGKREFFWTTEKHIKGLLTTDLCPSVSLLRVAKHSCSHSHYLFSPVAFSASFTLMSTFLIRLLFAAVTASYLLSYIACTPIEDVYSSRNTPLVELETTATNATSHWVIYSDKWVSGETGPPDPSAIEVCVQPAIIVQHRTFLTPLRRVSILCEFPKQGTCLGVV